VGREKREISEFTPWCVTSADAAHATHSLKTSVAGHAAYTTAPQ